MIRAYFLTFIVYFIGYAIGWMSFGPDARRWQELEGWAKELKADKYDATIPPGLRLREKGAVGCEIAGKRIVGCKRSGDGLVISFNDGTWAFVTEDLARHPCRFDARESFATMENAR